MIKNFIALLLFCLSINAYAWSALGHQLVCDIAWQESSAEVRSQLGASAKRMGYDTFASACIWADHVRTQKKYDWLKPLHYMNVPRRASTVNLKRDCGSKGFSFFSSKKAEPSCVLNAIDYFGQRINQQGLSQLEQDEALLLLGHFVGDIHQPLHVGYKDDRGGTRTKTNFKGRSQSLHYFWDNTVLGCGKYLHWRQLSKTLNRGHLPALGSAEPADWANESLSITRELYGSSYKITTPKDCQAYQKLAYKRLQVAGVRLAGYLEHSLR